VAATGLTLDSQLPVNERYRAHVAAKVAERLVEIWPELFEPTPSLAVRIARANSALLVRPGVERSPTQATYH
jgi:hypothetical protein